MAFLTASQLVLVAIVFLLAYVATTFLTSRRKGLPLPPGPSPLPIVGNVADLPPPGLAPFKHWIKHKDLYGPISSVRVMGQPIIIIHDANIAFELMEKRSNIHSDRPILYFAAHMCGWDKWIAFQGHNSLTRAYRKDIHSVVGTKAMVAQYTELQETEMRRFLLRVYKDPEQTIDHVATSISAIILQAAYGYKIDQVNPDPLIELVEDAMASFSDAATPGRWLVDVLPSLRHVPDWMPGTGFKQIARQYKRLIEETANRPYAFVKQQLANNTHSPSLTSALLEKERQPMSPETEARIKLSAAAMYAGGADTQIATLKWFFVSILLHPDAQRAAQAEIDAVIPPSRLPTFSDREQLPYISALFKEVLRWNTIGTMGLPHTSSADDTIQVKLATGQAEYLIPKGSMLLPSVWSFMRDPARYKNPDVFDPTRFLGPCPETDPSQFAFGFGRRICPGRILADVSAWLLVVQTLAVFNVERKRDENGREVPVEAEGVDGLVYHPLPGFTKGMKVSVRGEKARVLLEGLEKEGEELWGSGDAAILDSVRVDYGRY